VASQGDNTAQLWDRETGSLLQTLHGHTGTVNAVAFSRDGHTVVTGSSDKTARLWDASTGQEIRSFEGHTSDIQSVAISPDGHSVLTGSRDNSARLWDKATGQQLRSFTGETVKVSAVSFSPDGRFLLTGNWDNTARMWDTATGGQVHSFSGHSGTITSVAFSPDGRSVLTGSWDKTARLWDADTGQLIQSFAGHKDAVESVAFSPDGRSVVTGSWDHTAKVWDRSTGQCISTFNHTDTVNTVAFSPDSRYVMTGAGYEDSVARLWDVATGKVIHAFEGYGSQLSSVAFSRDGHSVLIGMDDKAVLWDWATEKEIRTFKGKEHWIESVTFSPDGRFVLTGSDNNAVLWDITTGQEVKSFEGHSASVNSVAFSPDGRFIVTGSEDTTTRLWDTAAGKESAALISFKNSGWAVVDPEGRFDSSNLDGGAPLVWVASSEPMRALPLEIFMHDYYTPRLLASIANHNSLPPIRPISEIKNRVQPDVGIVSIIPSKTYSGRTNVLVHAASKTNAKGQTSGLEDLRLFRDGQLIGYREGSLQDGDFAFPDIQLSATTRFTTFTAYAFNAEHIKSTTVHKDYQYEPGPVAKPRAWLLQIGVDHYRASGCELNDSANDAVELSSMRRVSPVPRSSHP
jgi:WD40 repeat protein